MTERPIIFSAPMVMAILAGRKSMTRRLLTPRMFEGIGVYEVGDRLWVREGIKARNMDLGGMLGLSEPLTKVDPTRGDLCVSYAADDTEALNEHEFNYAWVWKRLSVPSIHMPRAMSRITLCVKARKVERLQDILHADAIAEGVEGEGCRWKDYQGIEPHFMNASASFASLWNTIHGPDAWKANPLVVAISFEVEKANG